MAEDTETPGTVRDAHLSELGHTPGEALHIGGLSATELGDRFGTPLYVYDAEVLRRRFRDVKAALGERVEISYALKANPTIAVAHVLRRAGASAEVASAGEIHAAVAAGFSGPEIQFAGPGKSRGEIELALRQDLARLNIESPAEYALIAELGRDLGRRPGVAVRVNPEQAISGARMHMGGGSQKFGVDVEQLEGLIRRIVTEDAVELRGLHVYGGTQCFDADAWLENAAALIALAARLEGALGIRLPELNFGGGFGVPYYEGDPAFDLRKAGTELRKLIAADQRAGRSYHVELGRYLVAPAGVYLLRVAYIKESGGRRIVIVDGGMNHHAAAAGMGSIMRRSFPIVACRDVEGEGAPWGLGGPLCTPADEFASEVVLPELERGDLVGILASGAYGLTFSNVLFLGHPMPAEVLVDRRTATVVRQRGTPEDALRGQALPEGTGP